MAPVPAPTRGGGVGLCVPPTLIVHGRYVSVRSIRVLGLYLTCSPCHTLSHFLHEVSTSPEWISHMDASLPSFVWVFPRLPLPFFEFLSTHCTRLAGFGVLPGSMLSAAATVRKTHRCRTPTRSAALRPACPAPSARSRACDRPNIDERPAVERVGQCGRRIENHNGNDRERH